MTIFPLAGMVSQEEYEYSAFKCAFCKALNPAKKLRPVAPRLPLPAMPLSGMTAGEQQSILQRSAIAARSEEPSSSTSVSDKESSKFCYIRVHFSLNWQRSND